MANSLFKVLNGKGAAEPKHDDESHEYEQIGFCRGKHRRKITETESPGQSILTLVLAAFSLRIGRGLTLIALVAIIVANAFF